MEFSLNPARGIGYVLIVDDVPAMAELIAGWFQKAGYRTKVVDNYEAAKQILDTDPPLLLIVDDCHGDSPSILERLPIYLGSRNWPYPDTIAILLTENLEKWNSPYCSHTGFHLTLAKPFSPSELIWFCDRFVSFDLWPQPNTDGSQNSSASTVPKQRWTPSPRHKAHKKHRKRRRK